MKICKVEEGDALYPAMLELFPSTARYIADPNDHGNYHFFAAVDEQAGPIGGAVIDIRPLGFGPLAEMMTGFLENIEVDEVWRRQGIGRQLMEAVLAFAWQQNAQHVRWTVDWANPGAPEFYASCGAAVLPEGDSPETPETYYTLAIPNPNPPRR